MYTQTQPTPFRNRRAFAAPAPLRSIQEDELREKLTKDNTGPTKGKPGDAADRGGEEVGVVVVLLYVLGFGELGGVRHRMDWVSWGWIDGVPC